MSTPRTIVNPVYGSPDSSAVMRNELQLLENEIAALDDATNVITTRGDIMIGGTDGSATRLAIGASGLVLKSDGTDISWGSLAGVGDVVGPSSSTDNAIVRFDGTTGKLVQNSSATINDSGQLVLTPALSDDVQAQFIEANIGSAQGADGKLYFYVTGNASATDTSRFVQIRVGDAADYRRLQFNALDYFFYKKDQSCGAVLSCDSLATSNKTFTFPNKSGTFAMTDDVPNIDVETTDGLSHSLTTTAGQRVVVFVKGDMQMNGSNREVFLKYNNVQKDTVRTTGTNGHWHAFALEYTETPGAATQDITVTGDGTLENVVIIVMKIG